MAFYVIQDWMTEKLDLKGHDLNIFAIIYGFSQDGESRFNGSLNYLAKLCNASKRCVQNSLKNLCDLGFIEKHEAQKNGVKLCEYNATVWQKMPYPIAKNTTNNIEDNKDKENISIPYGIDIFEKAAPTPQRHKYGNYHNVLLSNEEFDKFCSECPEALDYIERLSEYIAMKNPAYKNHLAVLRNWVRRDNSRKKPSADSFMDELARLYQTEDI